jgi:hypothetical protein
VPGLDIQADTPKEAAEKARRCQTQTRGTLAMLAQWISLAAREHFDKARREPLIT